MHVFGGESCTGCISISLGISVVRVKLFTLAKRMVVVVVDVVLCLVVVAIAAVSTVPLRPLESDLRRISLDTGRQSRAEISGTRLAE